MRDWYLDVLCTQVDVGDVFFPDKGGSTRPAKDVCARCTVRTPCLREALSDPSLSGVWGGTTERERQEMRRAVMAS